MRNEISKFKTFERRAFIFGGIKLTAFSMLTGRLYQLQVIKSEKYKNLSEDNRVKLLPIMASRGKILDRNGVSIAENQNYYKAVYEVGGKGASKASRVDKEVINKVIEILKLSLEEQEYLFKKIADIKGNKPEFFLISEYLNWEEVAKIEVNKPDLPGVYIDSGKIRYYPYPETTSHLIGYIAPPNKKEVKNHSTIYSHSDFRIGKNGIEKIVDSILQGKPGITELEVDAYGNHIRELSSKNSINGRDISLTIDIDLQQYTAERLAGMGGVKKEGSSAVVIDVDNGDILAMVSRPSFDANHFIKGISHKLWGKLSSDPDVPLVNKTISSQYPPGSTFKTIVALAALEAGTINRNTTFHCPGYYQLGRRRFNCWRAGGHGSLSVRDAIKHSCNVFFYNIAHKLGVDRIAEMASKFGLGALTNIELPNEKAGLIPTKEWKFKTKGQDWHAGETLNTGIGQGDVLATPLQLAVATARIASLGKLITPRLIKGNPELIAEIKRQQLRSDNLLGKILNYGDDSNAQYIEGVSKSNIDLVRQGMEMVTNSAGGTAYLSRITIPGMELAGKTGTSQVTGRKFEGETVPRRFKNHALFIGFAPIAKPKFAVAVVVEHGDKGSSTAAPAGRDILLEAQKLIKA